MLNLIIAAAASTTPATLCVRRTCGVILLRSSVIGTYCNVFNCLRVKGNERVGACVSAAAAVSESEEQCFLKENLTRFSRFFFCFLSDSTRISRFMRLWRKEEKLYKPATRRAGKRAVGGGRGGEEVKNFFF